MKFVEVGGDVFAAKWDSGKYMLTQMWRSFPAPSPTVLYDLFYAPLGTVALAGSFYDDPAVNASLSQARETLDTPARVAAFQSVDAAIAADAPVTPIAYWQRTVVCSSRLHDATLDPMMLFDFVRVWIR